MLDLRSYKLLASAGHLDKVDFEGAWRHVRYLIGKAAELLAVRDDLQHRHIQLVEEGVDFWGCSQGGCQLWVANDGSGSLRKVDSSRVCTHCLFLLLSN